jgi:hypothetical protein
MWASAGILVVFFLASQSYGIVLDPLGKYTVNLTLNPNSGTVSFDLVVETNGFVEFGISNGGGLKEVDLLVAELVEGQILVQVTSI